MGSFLHTQATTLEPPGYITPPFPALYWPWPINGDQTQFLYRTNDVVRFTTVWTLVCYGIVHGAAALFACATHWRSWKVVWSVVPLVYLLMAGIEGTIAGSVVGGLLGSTYHAGYLRMSTWIPFVWALINTVVLILSSFAIQGGL